MELNLNPMSKLEQQYSYSHGEAVDAATRCLGHLRGDMGSTGKAFHFTWFDHCGELKTPAFKSEFDDVINALRFDAAAQSQSRRIQFLLLLLREGGAGSASGPTEGADQAAKET